MEECMEDCCEVGLAPSPETCVNLLCSFVQSLGTLKSISYRMRRTSHTYVGASRTWHFAFHIVIRPMTLAVRFVEEDPGRQSISGSFNPIDEGEWSESAYIQTMAKFFGAISK